MPQLGLLIGILLQAPSGWSNLVVHITAYCCNKNRGHPRLPELWNIPQPPESTEREF